MCGRAKLETDVSQLKIAFRVPPEYPTPNFAPSWNVAPTDNLPIVRYDPKAGSRTLDLMRWGLVPYWAKDIKIGFSTINAMAQTVAREKAIELLFQAVKILAPHARENLMTLTEYNRDDRRCRRLSMQGMSRSARVRRLIGEEPP